MSGLLIVGVGNRFRSDDGAGPRVVDLLLAQGIEAMELAGEGAELIESWAGASDVVVIDAAKSGAKPGTVYRFEAARKPLPAGFFHYSTHQFGVAEAIETARALGRLPASMTVYGIEGRCFSFGEDLSPSVAAACEAVAAEIIAGSRR
ncbi:MAG: hydrogenase maturation protease [Magnetospirillum sp. WYHS-4]